jgi:hypothetical protein
MFASEMKTDLQLRRVIVSATLLFVFFLPLHFHFYSSSQVAKECVCLHGTRTQVAVGSNVAVHAPQLWILSIPEHAVSIWTEEKLEQIYVRGPPSQASL